MGEMKMYTKFWWENPKERDYYGDPSVDKGQY
jgi:hypothetical protein